MALRLQNRASGNDSAPSESHFHFVILHNHLDDAPALQAKCGHPSVAGRSAVLMAKTLGISPQFARKNMTTIRFHCVLVVASLLLLSHSGAGQAVYGNIIGTVIDSSGAAVPNAPVTVTDIDRGTNYQTSTNASGNYEQTHLLAGRYK